MIFVNFHYNFSRYLSLIGIYRLVMISKVISNQKPVAMYAKKNSTQFRQCNRIKENIPMYVYTLIFKKILKIHVKICEKSAYLQITYPITAKRRNRTAQTAPTIMPTLNSACAKMPS